MRSERGSEGRSRNLPDRSAGRSGRSGARSFGAGGGGGVGAGARSPGLMPALRAAAVGRNTLTWRDGTTIGGFATSAAPLLGAAAAGAGVSIDGGAGGSIISGGAGAAGSARIIGGSITAGGGASTRAAGVNFLTSLAGAIGPGAIGL